MAESGRACVEFWCAIAVSKGIKLEIASSSTLLDTNVPINEKLYGYHRLDDPMLPLVMNDELIVRKNSELTYNEKAVEPMLIGRHDDKTSPVEPKEW